MGTLATDSELATIRAADAANQLNAVRALYTLPDAPWSAVTAKLGGVPTLRIFSSLPASSIRAAIATARIQEAEPQRALSPIEFTQVGLVWRVARQVMELPDIMLFEEGAVAAAAGATHCLSTCARIGQHVYIGLCNVMFGSVPRIAMPWCACVVQWQCNQ